MKRGGFQEEIDILETCFRKKINRRFTE